jgi:hypothetical protein
MKSSMAAALVEEFSRPGGLVFDPFCGAGTVALEAWSQGRRVVASDLNPYAIALTRAKLLPPLSLTDAERRVRSIGRQVRREIPRASPPEAPEWVSAFFHPNTLAEAVSWTEVLLRREEYFLLGCLLGILHHQRPGFLSYPSSHAVPYLKTRTFPRDVFPELYEHRAVEDRLLQKATRALRRVPPLDRGLERACFLADAAALTPDGPVDAIITSPPYMRQLDYGRDNRLRLWFLGCSDWEELDRRVSPDEPSFLRMMEGCFWNWRRALRRRGFCVLVLGRIQTAQIPDLPEAVVRIAVDGTGAFQLVAHHTEPIPAERRIRRGCRGAMVESVLVLRRR